jgi:hypothetical protein
MRETQGRASLSMKSHLAAMKSAMVLMGFLGLTLNAQALFSNPHHMAVV